MVASESEMKSMSEREGESESKSGSQLKKIVEEIRVTHGETRDNSRRKLTMHKDLYYI